MTARPAAPAPVPAPERAGGVAEGVLAWLVILFGLGMSVGAGWISWHSIGALAVRFEFPAETAWLIMPLLEGFLLLGIAEAALRVLEGNPRTLGPKTAAYSALAATLACNVTSHVLQLLDGHPGVATWRLAIIGGFAALIPIAQTGALHFTMGRLAAIAQRRLRGRRIAVEAAPRPGVLGQIARAAGERAVRAIEATTPEASSPTPAPSRAPGRAPARGRGRAPARRPGSKGGPTKVDRMRAYWDAERAAGRTPTEAELDRVADTNRVAKKYVRKWLAEEAARAVEHVDDELRNLTERAGNG